MLQCMFFHLRTYVSTGPKWDIKVEHVDEKQQYVYII